MRWWLVAAAMLGCSGHGDGTSKTSRDAGVASGDLWLCPCACSEFVVQAQGCAPKGLDDGVAADREMACASACSEGGYPCGLASACVIGGCRPGASSDGATIVGPSSCDPDGRDSYVTAMGDYHVTIDPGQSTLRLSLNNGIDAEQPVRGETFFNADDQRLDVAALYLAVADFTAGGHAFTNTVLFIHDRLTGTFTSAQDFYVYSGIGVVGIRWRWEGAPAGINVVNHDPWQGSIDVAGRRLLLDADGTDPDDAGQRATLHLVGVIDSVPPVANAGPDQSVACQSAQGTQVVLDASGSSDPDPGDSITHYQWVTSYGIPVDTTATVMPIAPPGQTTYVLHVYDQQLGAASDDITVTVSGTCP